MINMEAIEHILADSEKLLISMKKYKRILDSLYWTDVSKDRNFQRAFNDFFVMRSRKSEYYVMFYSFLEQKKAVGVSFEETLEFLKQAIPHGLIAMETVYSTYSEEQTELAKKIAEEFNLKQSGGSDFHGYRKSDISLATGRGNLIIPYEFCQNLRP